LQSQQLLIITLIQFSFNYSCIFKNDYVVSDRRMYKNFPGKTNLGIAAPLIIPAA
jgi:hypothetical protein